MLLAVWVDYWILSFIAGPNVIRCSSNGYICRSYLNFSALAMLFYKKKDFKYTKDLEEDFL